MLLNVPKYQILMGNGFKTLQDPISAYIMILADMKHFQEIWIFGQNRILPVSHFSWFSMLHKVMPHMAGSAEKCDRGIKMASLSP